MAVSNFYSHLSRGQNVSRSRSHSRSRQQESNNPQRIYLLPHPANRDSSVQLVYAPVSLSSLPKDIRDSATEAWVSRTNPSGRHSRTSSDSSCSNSCVQAERPHRHHRRHSHGHHHRQSRSSSATRTGRICLPIEREEGLLPTYYADADTKA